MNHRPGSRGDGSIASAAPRPSVAELPFLRLNFAQVGEQFSAQIEELPMTILQSFNLAAVAISMAHQQNFADYDRVALATLPTSKRSITGLTSTASLGNVSTSSADGVTTDTESDLVSSSSSSFTSLVPLAGSCLEWSMKNIWLVICADFALLLQGDPLSSPSLTLVVQPLFLTGLVVLPSASRRTPRLFHLRFGDLLITCHCVTETDATEGVEAFHTAFALQHHASWCRLVRPSRSLRQMDRVSLASLEKWEDYGAPVAEAGSLSRQRSTSSQQRQRIRKQSDVQEDKAESASTQADAASAAASSAPPRRTSNPSNPSTCMLQTRHSEPSVSMDDDDHVRLTATRSPKAHHHAMLAQPPGGGIGSSTSETDPPAVNVVPCTPPTIPRYPPQQKQQQHGKTEEGDKAAVPSQASAITLALPRKHKGLRGRLRAFSTSTTNNKAVTSAAPSSPLSSTFTQRSARGRHLSSVSLTNTITGASTPPSSPSPLRSPFTVRSAKCASVQFPVRPDPLLQRSSASLVPISIVDASPDTLTNSTPSISTTLTTSTATGLPSSSTIPSAALAQSTNTLRMTPITTVTDTTTTTTISSSSSAFSATSSTSSVHQQQQQQQQQQHKQRMRSPSISSDASSGLVSSTLLRATNRVRGALSRIVRHSSLDFPDHNTSSVASEPSNATTTTSTIAGNLGSASTIFTGSTDSIDTRRTSGSSTSTERRTNGSSASIDTKRTSNASVVEVKRSRSLSNSGTSAPLPPQTLYVAEAGVDTLVVQLPAVALPASFDEDTHVALVPGGSIGVVLAGRRDKLVELLASDETVSSEYVTTMLLAHDFFINKLLFIDMLVSRFSITPFSNITAATLHFFRQWKRVIQFKVIAVMHAWVSSHWLDFVRSRPLRERLDAFVARLSAMGFIAAHNAFLSLIRDVEWRYVCSTLKLKARIKTNAAGTIDAAQSILLRSQPLPLSTSTPTSEPRQPVLTSSPAASTTSVSVSCRVMSSFGPDSVLMSGWSTLDIAEQLTLLDHDLFCLIPPRQFLDRFIVHRLHGASRNHHDMSRSNSDSGDSNGDSTTLNGSGNSSNDDNLAHKNQEQAITDPAVSALALFTARFDTECYWAATQVCVAASPQRCAATVAFLLDIADRALDLGNYFTSAAIQVALQLTPVRELTAAWDLVPARSLAIRDRLDSLLSHTGNMRAYRRAVKDIPAGTPIVPFLPLYLKDLVFINDGNAALIDDSLVNFDRLRMMAATVASLSRHQTTPFNIASRLDVQSWIFTSESAIVRTSDMLDRVIRTVRKHAHSSRPQSFTLTNAPGHVSSSNPADSISPPPSPLKLQLRQEQTPRGTSFEPTQDQIPRKAQNVQQGNEDTSDNDRGRASRPRHASPPHVQQHSHRTRSRSPMRSKALSVSPPPRRQRHSPAVSPRGSPILSRRAAFARVRSASDSLVKPVIIPITSAATAAALLSARSPDSATTTATAQSPASLRVTTV